MSAEIAVVERFFAAVNRNDIEAVGSDFDQQIVRIEPAGFPTAGTYRGADAVREHVASGRRTWAEGSCEPERFFANDDRVVVYLRVRVRLKSSGEWIEGRFADGFTFRDGRIVEYLSFGERADALRWARIQDPEAIRPWSD